MTNTPHDPWRELRGGPMDPGPVAPRLLAVMAEEYAQRVDALEAEQRRPPPSEGAVGPSSGPPVRQRTSRRHPLVPIASRGQTDPHKRCEPSTELAQPCDLGSSPRQIAA